MSDSHDEAKGEQIAQSEQARNQSSEAGEESVEEALQKLSREKPEQVTEIMAMMGTGTTSNPLHHKMTESHITQVLDLASKHDEREYNLHKTSQTNDSNESTSVRRYTFCMFIVLVVLVVIVLLLFKDSPKVLVPILTGMGGLVGGFMGGWGFSQTKK